MWTLIEPQTLYDEFIPRQRERKKSIRIFGLRGKHCVDCIVFIVWQWIEYWFFVEFFFFFFCVSLSISFKWFYRNQINPLSLKIDRYESNSLNIFPHSSVEFSCLCERKCNSRCSYGKYEQKNKTTEKKRWV